MFSSDQYSALAELAGGFIHEIKNRLSTLGLNLQLLAEDFQDAQSQRERRALSRVQRLQAECQRASDLANDFLRFARIQDLDRKPTDLHKVIVELMDFLGPSMRKAHIQTKLYLPADLPAVLLDRELFKQALLNLVLNAEQAMPQGGVITVQATMDLDGRHVDLSVIDTGLGITEETRQKLFRPFHSTKPGGSGLGLPTTRRILEAHGGTIDVQSELGRGTKFTIRLPVNSENQPGP
jgi:two-component system sensor histidine kinase HydH